MKTQQLLVCMTLLTGCLTLGSELMSQEVQSVDEMQKLKQELGLAKATIDTYKPGKSRFLLRGYAQTGLQVNEESSTFVGGSFNPLFIYRQSDKLLFESELEFELNGEGLEIGLEYANISYLISKTVTLRAGKLLSPMGIFIPNLHPTWINKVPTAPLGAGHDGILPTSDIGVEMRGGAYLGNLKFNYALSVTNGPSLNDGEHEPEEGGMLHYGSFPDNNKNKALGGRIGVFPLSNSSLELGVSALTGKVGDQESDYEDVSAFVWAIDLSYVQKISALSSMIDLKGQFTMVNVEDAFYPDHENGDEFITFDNESTAWFGQFAFRPALVENGFARNLEFVARYSSLLTPEDAGWHTDQTQWDFGINYWLDWRTLIKLSYRIRSGEAEHGGGGHDPHGGEFGGNAFFVQWAIGL